MVQPLTSLRARLAIIEEQSYYEILRVPSTATQAEMKAAFHEFALACHPDQYIDEPPEVAFAAGEVFKRGVEAYKVLTNADWRAKYDGALLKGKLRFVPGEAEKPPAPPPTRTLEEIARTPRAKQFAMKADRLISVGKLEEARVALVTAMQDDYDNDELKERLNVLYEALALEPL
jgi:curved DNA-binding protein CbpA